MKLYSTSISLCIALIIGLTSCSTTSTTPTPNSDTKVNSGNTSNAVTNNNASSVISEDKKQNDGFTTLSFLNLTFKDESGAVKDLAFSDITSVKVGGLTLTKSDTNAFSVKLGESNLIFQSKEKGLYSFRTADISKVNLNDFIKKGSVVSIETSKNFTMEINAEIVFKQLLTLAAKSNLSGIEPVMGQLNSTKLSELLSKLDSSSTNIISTIYSINTNSEDIVESDSQFKPISGGSKLVVVKGGAIKESFTLPADITIEEELTLYKDSFATKGSKLSVKNKLPSDLKLNGDNSISSDYKVSTDLVLLKGSSLAMFSVLKSGSTIPKMLFVDSNTVLFDDNYSSYLKNKKLQ